MLNDGVPLFFSFPFSFQCPDNYDLSMRYRQFLFRKGAGREMCCELCELCKVPACTTNTRPKNYVMGCAVQWVLKASVARTMFSAKLGCALSPWQPGGLATVSGKWGGTDFLFLLLYLVFVAVEVYTVKHNHSSWLEAKHCLCCLLCAQ